MLNKNVNLEKHFKYEKIQTLLQKFIKHFQNKGYIPSIVPY